ncbi:Mediator of RNA polymerase II transcription subunit 1 [Mizuhopecten yessoensis]|uniref:Mediator of RNA polymerase II transcription subunit 1 n=1 Tax=Mizuhopecten yessoensis TaxID=6573 RepID=A0A210PSH3_MIZYE|nr:Mediator of RNA polymerase II transcription subunit 1 [Mizuhopecten yessoensis]
MAAALGDTPSSWDNHGDSTDAVAEKGPALSLLMDKLHGRAAQHKNWDDSIKAVRMAIMNDKRQQSDALERMHIQTCLDKLHRAIKVVNQQSLLERLESIARQLGLSFSVPSSPENRAVISSEMFGVEIIMETGGVVKDVKVFHNGDPTSCEELTEILSKGQFDEFVVHLEGLQDIYKIPGDKKQKSKAFLALHSLETDLNNLAQLQSAIKGVANCIHKSPLGILLPRKGGCPMKLIYFVSPYDLLDKKTKSPHPMTVEAITEYELGQSVTVCIEPCSPNKLQTIPLMSVVKQDGKSLPCFQGLSNVNSCTLSASFVLVLPQPIPVAMSNVQSIQSVTELDVISVGETKPLLQLINQHAAKSKSHAEGNEFFVTLPDQQHVYFMSDISGCSLDQPAVMVSRIPFTHPTSVAQVLNHLRQQVIFNTVIESCIRPNAQQDIKSSVVFDLAAASLQSLTVTFEHPLQDTMVTADVDLCDITNVKFKVCIGQDGEELCSDDIATKIFQRCLSIPVTLRSVIHKVSEKLRKEPSPEPVPTNNHRKQWPNFLPIRHNPVHYHMDNKIQQTNLLHNLLPPQQVPIKMQPNMAVPLGLPQNPSMDTSTTPTDDKPSSNPLLATLLDQDSPSPDSSPVTPVNESPMLSKLLGDDTPALASSIPAPRPQKPRKLGKRRSRDTLSGRSPKHRVSDSDSSSVSMDHLDSSISFDDLHHPGIGGGGVGATGGGVGHPLPQTREGSTSNMTIDLTTPELS